MYSKIIQPKVAKMFDELQEQAKQIVVESGASPETAERIANLVSSETATRSKTLLSDMLYALTEHLYEDEFFEDDSLKNAFSDANLRKEIMDKYQFTSSVDITFRNMSSISHSLAVGGAVGGAVLVAGGVGEIAVTLARGLSLSTLVPLPVGVLVGVSLLAAVGSAAYDGYVREPKKKKEDFFKVLENYFSEAGKQFLLWFDEVENYFNRRAGEIMKTL